LVPLELLLLVIISNVTAVFLQKGVLKVNILTESYFTKTRGLQLSASEDLIILA